MPFTASDVSRKTSERDGSTAQSAAAVVSHLSESAEDETGAASFKAQVERLLGVDVPISLGSDQLESDAAISCGGSHVVEWGSYGELREKAPRLSRVLPEKDIFQRQRTDRPFSSCAVVGNSGSLLESQLGAEIDDHDVIIRFNQGITEGYEQFVGSRTTYRIFNKADVAPKEPGEVVISTLRNNDFRAFARALIDHEQYREAAFAFNPEFLCYCWHWVARRGQKPSSGLVGMVLALRVCDKIDAYGFQPDTYFSADSRPHYYNWERPAKGRERVHPFRKEHMLFEKLQDAGYLRLRP